MIKLVDIKNTEAVINVKHFSDNTQNLSFQESLSKLLTGLNKIVWNYEKDEELITLIYFVNWYRDNYHNDGFILEMPYVPNARMDRVKSKEDVFTLKYFANILNSLNFKEVRILDPHSYVSSALINNVNVITPENYIEKTVNITDIDIICYPDHGSEKRYAKTFKLPYICGVKNRDWKTREIKSLSIIDNGLNLEGKKILIVDDIISTGGTIIHIANKLREFNVKEINIYASHIEDAASWNPDLKKLILKGTIKKIYTPNFLPQNCITNTVEIIK